MKKPLIVIAGPTAVGKTDISLELAKRVDGQIISADSMQIYKYMDIGTAKLSKEKMQGITHYLIDCLYPDEEYSVAVFQKMAKECLAEIYDKNKIPILVGGTGFYVNALIYDNNFVSVCANYEYRGELAEIAKEKGNKYLHEELMQIDPESAEKIHFNNVKRVIRALEYFKLTSEKISKHNELENQRDTDFDVSFIVLSMERNLLYKRIDKRVDKMIELGLVHEVSNLLEMGYSKNLTSMQGLGYKEIIPYLKGEISLEDAINILKRNTRHFAKRQITWFKNQAEGSWIDINESPSSLTIIDNIKSKLLL